MSAHYKPKMQNARFWRKNENKFGFWTILYYLCTRFHEFNSLYRGMDFRDGLSSVVGSALPTNCFCIAFYRTTSYASSKNELLFVRLRKRLYLCAKFGFMESGEEMSEYQSETTCTEWSTKKGYKPMGSRQKGQE